MAKARRTHPRTGAATGLPAGPLVLRFALGYLAIGALLYLVREPLTELVGRAARDLLALADPAPRISGIGWAKGFAVSVESPLIGGSFSSARGGWPFALLFPLGVLVGAPGIEPIERLRRGLLIAVGGLTVAALLLGGSAAYALGDRLGGQGLVLYPAARQQAHYLIAFWSWSLYAIAYPVVASLYALAPALPALRARFGLDFEASPARGRPATPRWRRAAPLVLAITAALAIDAIGTRRVRTSGLDELVQALEPINDDVGGYFLRAGNRELGRDKTDQARRYFTIALRYPEHATQAREGLRQVRAASDAARSGSRGSR